MNFFIDYLAYHNRLSIDHPMEKLVFSIGTLFICLAGQTVTVPLLIFVVMSSILLLYARIPPGVYRNLLCLPLGFILVGLIPILIQIGGDSTGGWMIGHLGGWAIWISREAYQTGLLILARSLGCVCCMYFLLLTTPMMDLLSILRRLRVPSLFCEMMLFIYRFIFILWDSAGCIYQAQISRGGYGTLRMSFLCLAELVTTVFAKSIDRGQRSYLALMSRGYDGEVRVLERKHRTSKRNWWLISLWECTLLWIVVRGY